MQNQFSPTGLQCLSKRLGVGEPFAPAHDAGYRWMMNKNNAKQALLARFQLVVFEVAAAGLSDAADRQKSRTGLRRGNADKR